MIWRDFCKKLHKDYPLLYPYVVDVNITHIDRLAYSTERSWHIVHFMNERNLPDDTSFEELFNYICQNDDKHEWWML